jgi:hypothetical protein
MLKTNLKARFIPMFLAALPALAAVASVAGYRIP